MDQSQSASPQSPPESCCKVDPYRTVTPLSKALAMATFILLPIGTFFLGMQMVLPKVIEVPYPVVTARVEETATPSASLYENNGLKKVKTALIPKDLQDDKDHDCLRYDCGVDVYFDPKEMKIRDNTEMKLRDDGFSFESGSSQVIRELVTNQYIETPCKGRMCPKIEQGMSLIIRQGCNTYNIAKELDRHNSFISHKNWYSFSPFAQPLDSPSIVYMYTFKNTDDICYTVTTYRGVDYPADIAMSKAISVISNLHFR